MRSGTVAPQTEIYMYDVCKCKVIASSTVDQRSKLAFVVQNSLYSPNHTLAGAYSACLPGNWAGLSGPNWLYWAGNWMCAGNG